MPFSQAECRRHIAMLDAADPHRVILPPLDAAPAPQAPADPAHAAAEPAPDTPTRTPRHDGWTPERQRTFLDAVAEGYSAEQACRLAGMSPSSAYAFRKRAAGQAFSLGWRAASLLGRDRIADTLLTRAVDGCTETVTRPNGDVVERHRFDNRLAMSMLARLDRQAEAADPGSAAANAAARLVAAEFDAYLDLLGRPDAQARAGLFLARRAEQPDRADATTPAPADALARADTYLRTGAGLPTEIDTADLDLAARADWTAEQWRRADAAGLLAPTARAPEEDSPLPPLHGPEEDPGDVPPGEDCLPVWFNAGRQEWRTSFPPPPGFRGEEQGDYGDGSYERSLSRAELAVVRAEERAQHDLRRRMEGARRDRWFLAAEENAAAIREELTADADEDLLDWPDEAVPDPADDEAWDDEPAPAEDAACAPAGLDAQPAPSIPAVDGAGEGAPLRLAPAPCQAPATEQPPAPPVQPPTPSLTDLPA